MLLFALVVLWVIVALGCWLGYHLIRQNGRILVRLDALEQQLRERGRTPAPPTPGLAVGSIAPEFELSDLSGTPRSLSEFSGKRLLLFFNPHCGYCTRMAPDLAAMPTDGSSGRPIPLIITTGDIEENRELAREHALLCPVLIQKQQEIGQRYGAHGTPMGYLIDDQGRIASELTVGADALLALAGQGGRSSSPITHRPRVGNRPLSESKISRGGLAAGSPAPSFRLPRLDGGEFSLEEYGGRHVLLVFSDPHCGPCDQLMRELEAWRRSSNSNLPLLDSPSLGVLIVSRGDLQANRGKSRQLDLTIPIVLQKKWEISKLYGIFATPVAFWIDEQGTIAREVAVGVDPILELVRDASIAANGTSDTAQSRKRERADSA